MNNKSWLKYLWHFILALVALVIFVLATKALINVTKTIHIADVWQAIANIPTSHLIVAFLVVMFGYVLLTMYDIMALKMIDRKVDWRKVMMTSFTAYAISHTVGANLITATGVRYRHYRLSGLESHEIANIVWLVSMAFTFGICSLIGISLTLSPDITLELLSNLDTSLGFLDHAIYIQGLGIVILAVIVGLIIFAGKNGKHLMIKKWRFDLPPASILVKQILISILDLSTVALVLYLLLPSSEHISYLATFSAFIQSIAIGILSQVPGGLGVFELTMMTALPKVDKVQMLGVLLIFRLMYYIIPFLMALMLLIGYEVYLLLQKPKNLTNLDQKND